MKKILVIEDHQRARNTLVDILTLAGYDVEASGDGREGVRKTMQIIPDLIICDVLLPELSGYQILEFLKKSNVTQDIPFIFMVDSTAPEDIRKGMSLGADDYFIRPIDSVDLLSAIATRLSKSRKGPKGLDDQLSILDEVRGMEILQGLCKDEEVRKYLSREQIFKEGDVPRYLYVVKTGRVEISKSNHHGKELVLDVFDPGDFFGYEDLVFDLPHRDSALAMDNDVSVLLVPRKDFLEALLSNRQFSALIIKHLATAIERKEQRMLSIAYDSVRKRIATALIRLGPQGKNKGTGVKVFRQDLSNMVGTAKESVSRTLSEFRKENLIEIRGGKITIINLEGLANLQG